MIAARLDGLPDDEKASCRTPRSSAGLLAGAVARSGVDRGAVSRRVGRLRVKELVLRTSRRVFSDELEFAFRHVLIRDGAYDSLPKALRAEKHAERGPVGGGTYRRPGRELAESSPPTT